MKKIMTVLFILFIVGCSPQQQEQINVDTEKEITIGALLPLTGELESIGKNVEAALNLAVEDANSYFSEIGSNTHVSILLEDTQTNEDVALEKFNNLQAQGVNVFIGPLSSQNLKKIEPMVEDSIIFSPTSTAIELAKNDNIFRFALDDSHQAKVISTLIKNDEIETLISIVRDDVWGNGLYEATLNNLDVETIVFKYDPANISSIASEVYEKTKTVDNKIGIHLISYKEGIDILESASEFEELSNMNWYGNDGIAANVALVENEKVAQFASKTNLVSPAFGNCKENPKFDNLLERITDVLGQDAEPYSVAAYDSFWILVNSHMDNPTPENLKKSIMTTSQYYYGASGWTIFNEAGDRIHGEYDLWKVVEDNEGHSWKSDSRYQFDLDEDSLIQE